MKLLSAEEKIQRHLDYWSGKTQKRPLTIVRTGDWFFSREFAANKPLLEKNRPLTPDEIHVEEYLHDYDRMYETLNSLPTDAFFSAEPCTGFPWMEGIMGAKVLGAQVSFVTHPSMESMDDLEGFSVSLEDNPWYDKYLEFAKALTEHGRGRFSVSQPILRGVTDTIGALIGQEELACGVLLEPELMAEAFDKVVKTQRSLISDAYKIIEPFMGGYSFGFYHIWAPGKVIWYQEDLAALLSPGHFDEFLKKTSLEYIEGYDYTLSHMHPASFHHIDGVTALEGLKVVQINKDSNGPTVRDMLPVFKKVLEAGKNLAIGMGRIDRDDIDAIMDGLPRERVAVNIISDTPDEALQLIEYMDGK